MDPEVSLVGLADGRYMVEFDDRPDALGPFEERELRALWHELRDMFETVEEW